jgi:GT2 family glycosyltransferase
LTVDDQIEATESPAELVGALSERVERLERRLAELEAGPDREQAERPLELARRRLRDWTTPRLGVVAQHAPRPLMLPAGYLGGRPPEPVPGITVVTPSYNQGEFVGRTIESVLAQGYPGLEYVVQDGGSDDGSTDAIRSYQGLLTRWESAPDGGQADAVNRGFAGTSGEIMAWLNSDDLLLPGSLAHVARYFADHPDVDLVYGHRAVVDRHDLQIGSWFLPPHDDEVLTLVDYVPQETMFWRRSLWERAGGHLDERYRFALDWELLLRFRAAGARMVRLPRLLGAFRSQPAQKNQTLGSVASEEVQRLLEQMHGRHVGPREIEQRTAAYLRRHVALHSAHQARDRLPLPRVQAVPEMRLDTPGA